MTPVDDLRRLADEIRQHTAGIGADLDVLRGSKASDTRKREALERLDGHVGEIDVVADRLAAAESQREAVDVERLPGALARVLNPYLDGHPLPVHPASHRQWKRLADELVAALKEKPL